MYRDPKKHEILPQHEAVSEQCPKKKGKKSVFNFEVLSHEYQYAILSGLFQCPEILDKPLRVLHLGTGAGIMPMFLKTQLRDKVEKIVTIDINDSMLRLAEKFFGFVPDSQLESVCADAFKWVQDS